MCDTLTLVDIRHFELKIGCILHIKNNKKSADLQTSLSQMWVNREKNIFGPNASRDGPGSLNYTVLTCVLIFASKLIAVPSALQRTASHTFTGALCSFASRETNVSHWSSSNQFHRKQSLPRDSYILFVWVNHFKLLPARRASRTQFSECSWDMWRCSVLFRWSCYSHSSRTP